jgi:hypothetical protein
MVVGGGFSDSSNELRVQDYLGIHHLEALTVLIKLKLITSS